MSPDSCAQDFEDDVVKIRRTGDVPEPVQPENVARLRPRRFWGYTLRRVPSTTTPKSPATLKRRAKNKAARAARKKSRK